MSAAADHLRDDRRRWARPGSAHDALVRLLKLLLPVAVGAVLAWLVLAPFARGGSEIGFLLDKNRAEVAPQRLRVEAARYTGTDDNGRRFTLTAAEAVQRSNADPLVRMRDLTAAMTLDDGPATLAAPDANFDPAADTVRASGPLRLIAAGGYRLEARGVAVDLRRRNVSGAGGVSGSLPVGTFTANRLEADLDTRVVRLVGNARLHINQGL